MEMNMNMLRCDAVRHFELGLWIALIFLPWELIIPDLSLSLFFLPCGLIIADLSLFFLLLGLTIERLYCIDGFHVLLFEIGMWACIIR